LFNLPGEGFLKLYHFPRAPHARKVNIFLHEKGIDIAREEVHLGTKENLQESFLKKNARGVLPVLELDNGFFLDESLAICRYLEALYPEPPLFGTVPVEKAVIDSWERHMEFDGYLPAQDAFRNSAERFANYAVAGMTEEFKAIPALAERGRRRLDIFFARLNQRLQESEYVGGDKFSMADITGVVTVDMAKRSGKILPDNLVHAQRWYKAMYERDSVSSTYIEG
jgi:glutathione S-transferase